jgi:hypothetical protein
MAFPRHTLSESNALRFKAIFDKAIETRKNMIVRITDFELSHRTMHQRINDALLWLIKYADGPSHKYTILRAQVKFSIVPEGVELKYKYIPLTVSQVDGMVIQQVSTQESERLKDSIMNFLNDSTRTTFAMKEQNFGTDDIEWIRVTLSSIKDLEFDVSGTYVIIHK